MTSGPFTIVELSGAKRSVVLNGRGLPFRPFSLIGAQRLKVTWLPGSPDATGTVLGSQLEPTALNGKWCDKYLNVGAPSSKTGTPPVTSDGIGIQTAGDAVALFESINACGSLVRVTWLRQVRIGYLARFEARWLNANDVEWGMDFTWVSKDSLPGQAVFATKTSAGDTVSAMRSAFDFLDKIKLPESFGLPTEMVNTLVGFVNRIQNLIFDLESQLAALVRQVLNPLQAIRGMVAILGSVREEAELMLGFLRSQAVYAFNGGDPLNVTSLQDSFGPNLEAEKYRREMEVWAKELRRLAEEQKQEQLSQIEGDVMATYVMRASEDLRDVSKKYYGSPFEWRRIMTFNSLTSVNPPAGTIILIPLANAGQGSQLERGS